ECSALPIGSGPPIRAVRRRRLDIAAAGRTWAVHGSRRRRTMARKRIAIACQGGGSQCAFVAGALKTLFGQHIHRRYDVVGLSGTSGGALTAALAWYGLLREAAGDHTPIEDRVLALWRDLTA